MKKLFILFFSISLYLVAHAQTKSLSDYQDRWQYYFNQYNSYTAGVSSLSVSGNWKKNKDIKSLTKTFYKYKKGKKIETAYSKQESTFDNGHITNYKNLKKGKLVTEYQYKYNKDKYYTNFKSFNKGKLYQEEFREYNDSNRVVKYVYYKNNKQKSNYVVEYMDYVKIIRQDNYRKNNTTPSYTWVYDYYEDGKKKMSEYYKNGKIKRRYLYTCDDEGEEVKDTVKTSKVCYLTEYNADSSYVKVFRNTDSKGKIRKQRYSYSKDGKLKSYESINAEGEVNYSYFYEYDENGNRIKYTYYRNSKLLVNQEFKYNANNKNIETIWYNKKSELSSRTVNKRDENDNIIETTRYNNKNELTSKYQYEYDDRGNKTKKIVYKKNKISKEYNYIYDYI